MTPDEIRAEHAAIVAEHGPWIGYNIALGRDVFTIGPDLVGSPELMVQAAAQNLTDLAGGSVKGLRILDLGAHEGGYAVALGLLGAEVVAVEGRRQNVVKAGFTVRALGLQERVRVLEADLRNYDLTQLGGFDIVLCYGLIYHLPVEDAVELARTLARICRRFVAFRTAVALRPNQTRILTGHAYRGRIYNEDQRHAGASIGNDTSFLFTRASFVQMLTDVGYRSVAEVLTPAVPGMVAMADSITVLGWPGMDVEPCLLPAVGRAPSERYPERRIPPGLASVAHPQQGWPWSWRDRVRHEFASIAFGPRRRL